MSLVLLVWGLNLPERFRLQSLRQYARRKRSPESAAAAGACFSAGSHIPWSTEFVGTNSSLWRFFAIGAIRPSWASGLHPKALGRTVSSY